MQDLRRIVWLASFPKSGNTWMRALLGNYLVAGAEPLDINSLNRFALGDTQQKVYDHVAGRSFKARDFNDWLQLRGPVLRSIAASQPAHQFMKTHCRIDRVGQYDLIPPELTAAAVYILRNPFDVVPSYARHLSLDIDATIGMMTNKDAISATSTGILEVIGRWDDHLHSWLEAPRLVRHALRYEDLIADTEKTVRGLLGFLQIPVRDGDLRRAIRASSFRNLQKQEQEKGFTERPQGMAQFFASGRAGGWREALTPAQVARIRTEFLPTLERYYPELLNETAEVAARA